MAVDIYHSPLIGKLLRNPLWQRIVQWFALLCLLALLVVAWGRVTLPGIADPWPLIYTNAATLLFWVLWFMGLVLTVPVLGRAWCGACPLGFVSERLGRVGLNLAWPKPPLSWLGIVAIFLAGLGGALYWNVHKSPHATALFVGLAGLLAVVSGLVWRRAAFCKLFCPVGLVLTVYSRFSRVYVARIDQDTCNGCEDRSCTARKGVWKRWDIGPSLVLQKKTWSGGCPVALTPATMDRSECQLCMECVRNCSKGNLGVFYGGKNSSAPFSTPAGVLFIFLTGLATLALSRTWPAVRDSLTPGIHPSSLVVALWLGAAVPALLLFAGPIVSHLGFRSAGRNSSEPSGNTAPEKIGEKEEGLTLWERFKVSATPFAGIVFGGHAALALVKLNAKGPYAPYLVYDPTGAATYMAINVSKTLPLPQMFMPLPVLRWVAMAVLLLGILAGLLETKKAWGEILGPAGKIVNWAAFAGLAIFYGALVRHWLFVG